MAAEPRWRHLLAHVLAATAYHDDANPTAAGATFWLLNGAAVHQRTHGQPATARPLLERALRIYETAYGPDYPEVATTLNSLGWALSRLGEPGIARPLYERALHIFNAAYGPDHPHVATTLDNLSWVLVELGESAAARPLTDRALHILVTTYGPDHPAAVHIRQALQQFGDPPE